MNDQSACVGQSPRTFVLLGSRTCSSVFFLSFGEYPGCVTSVISKYDTFLELAKDITQSIILGERARPSASERPHCTSGV